LEVCVGATQTLPIVDGALDGSVELNTFSDDPGLKTVSRDVAAAGELGLFDESFE